MASSSMKSRIRPLIHGSQNGVAAPILSAEVMQLIEAKKGIFLDIGCSDHKSPGSIGMDKRAVAGVDVCHDVEILPWPFPSECCSRMLLSHIIEHLDPSKMIDIFNEMWRIMKYDGQALISMPYAGSPRFWMDPTHRHAWTEVTPQYFSPGYPLYDVYRPKPWKINLNEWSSIGDLNVILSKIPE